MVQYEELCRAGDLGYGEFTPFYVASNVCIWLVKNQGSTNISTHTVSFCSLVALHSLYDSNALATVNRILNHTLVIEGYM